MEPRHPLYVVSKGRWQQERRLTVRALEGMGVPYRVVVEPQELEEYARVIDPSRLLVVDPDYQAGYDTCDTLGDSKPRGPGPARNFAWAHALSLGATWHWVLDDNIARFYRWHQNSKIRVLSGAFFRIMEDFCSRYTNVGMAGPAYEFFTMRRVPRPPFTLNTRIYSCNLIRCDLPFRWRGRYNEDTILSLDMLKAGWCTVQFNALLQKKTATQRLKGGNTDAFYVKEGTLEKSLMQQRVHPDVSRVVWRFNRWHHHVDYRPFRGNTLRRRPGLTLPEGPDEYGLRLVPHQPEAARLAAPGGSPGRAH